jgi:hypothetical protein
MDFKLERHTNEALMMKAVFFSTSLLCWNGNKKRLDIKRSAAHALILSTLLDKLEYNICQVQNKKEEREREREREKRVCGGNFTH